MQEELKSQERQSSSANWSDALKPSKPSDGVWKGEISTVSNNEGYSIEGSAGAKAVHADFNPSGHPAINEIKSAAAHYWNVIAKYKAICGEEGVGEQVARLTVAQRDIEASSMRAVSAVTYTP